MAGESYANLIDALKTYYPQDVIYEMVYEDQPLWALIPKNTKARGKSFETLLNYGGPTARSSVISKALTQAASSYGKYGSFKGQTYAPDYAALEVDQLTMLLSEAGSESAFLDFIQRDMKGTLHALGRSMGQSLYGTGSGVIGSTTVTTGTVITLVNADDIVNFEVGDVIQFATLETGGTLYGAGGERTITKITSGWDSTGVQFEVNTSVAGLSLMGTSYIVKSGDYDVKLKGLRAYLTAPGVTPPVLWSLDRTAHVTRQSGLKLDWRGKPLEELAMEALPYMKREGSSPTHAFCTFKTWSKFEKSQQARVVHVDVPIDGKVSIGFKAIEMVGPMGKPLLLMADVNCPVGEFFFLQMNTLMLHTVGEYPRIFDRDVTMLRSATEDSYGARFGGWAQMTCEAPGKSLRVLVDA